MKIPRGIVKDVLVQVDKFYFHVDFVMLDTQQFTTFSRHSSHLCPIALVVAYSFCRDIFSLFLLDFYHDIILQC